MNRTLAAAVAALILTLPACQPAPEGMVKIPSGPFIMGTDEVDTEGRAEELGLLNPWFQNEHPRRTVMLPTYYIDETEVTNDAYAAFVTAAGHRPPDHWRGARTPPEGTGNHPVTHVSWHDAVAFCKWSGNKVLPTETQWEKAARGKSGLIYPWGNKFDYEATNASRGHTMPVGSFPSGNSPYGVKDMVGNVWEWTADWYKAYPGSDLKDDRFGERYRVLRGNSWASVGHYPDREVFLEIVAGTSRASYRLYMAPEGRLNDVGFRCAKPS
ncbi:MAG: formylglycine-generating enzyme family protein [Leptospirillia bacterium]